MFQTLTSDSSIANEKDTLGGGSRVLESGLYPMKVKLAYGTKSDGGALGLVITLVDSDKRELRQTLWMTSGTAKGCKNFYEKDGQKNYLPGFLLANSLCLLTVGKEISELATEEKVIPVYNATAKAEVPTKVQMVMDLLGQEILVGVIKQIVDKTKKNEATGAYEPTGEKREENEIDKFFRARDRMTTMEIRAQVAEPVFANQWAEKWTNTTRDKSSKTAANGTAGAPQGTPSVFKANQPAANKPSTSLFGT